LATASIKGAEILLPITSPNADQFLQFFYHEMRLSSKFVMKSSQLEAKAVLPNIPHTGCQKGQKMPFLSVMTLTFDLHI